MGQGVKKNTPAQAESRAELSRMSRSKRMTDVHVCRCARADWKPTVEQANFVRSPVPFPPVLLDSCDSRWRNYVVLTTLTVRSVRMYAEAECRYVGVGGFVLCCFDFTLPPLFFWFLNCRPTAGHCYSRYVGLSSESHRHDIGC